jgi:Fur family transcriptional regulator, ferric uptake regulator
MANAVAREEKQVFSTYLTEHRLKRSEQREVIVDSFLRSDSHLSVDDLLRLVQRRRRDIGRTTVYRTLKLLQAAGLAQELDLQGETRFEREYKRKHHDHFICNSCHAIFEFSSPDIERLQDEIAADIGFVIAGHRHHIFGLCRRCVAKAAPREEPRR